VNKRQVAYVNARARNGYRLRMTNARNEGIEPAAEVEVESLDEADVRERLDEDPAEQRNREDVRASEQARTDAREGDRGPA
jgi:hypothetical protein